MLREISLNSLQPVRPVWYTGQIGLDRLISFKVCKFLVLPVHPPLGNFQGGVTVIVIVVAECPSLLRRRRGHFFFLVGTLALVLLRSHLGLLRRMDSSVEFQKESLVYIESLMSIPRGARDCSVKSHRQAFP
jgi:hypothetical protein